MAEELEKNLDTKNTANSGMFFVFEWKGKVKGGEEKSMHFHIVLYQGSSCG